jgi:hypothetical protein
MFSSWPTTTQFRANPNPGYPGTRVVTATDGKITIRLVADDRGRGDQLHLRGTVVIRDNGTIQAARELRDAAASDDPDVRATATLSRGTAIRLST